MARTHDMEDRPEMLATDEDRMLRARTLVQATFYTTHHNGVFAELTDIYVVWFGKVLQNWKALVSTNVKDNMYYEVTYNGDKGETYLDGYRKVVNVVVPD